MFFVFLLVSFVFAIGVAYACEKSMTPEDLTAGHCFVISAAIFFVVRTTLNITFEYHGTLTGHPVMLFFWSLVEAMVCGAVAEVVVKAKKILKEPEG